MRICPVLFHCYSGRTLQSMGQRAFFIDGDRLLSKGEVVISAPFVGRMCDWIPDEALMYLLIDTHPLKDGNVYELRLAEREDGNHALRVSEVTATQIEENNRL